MQINSIFFEQEKMQLFCVAPNQEYHMKNNKIVLKTILLCLLCAYSGYASSVKTLTVEKGANLILPVYLDDSNISEEIKSLHITIKYNSDLFEPIGFRVDNGILSDYNLSETLAIEGIAIANIRGTGVYTQFGSVVEFVLTANDVGTATVDLESIYGISSLSGGFWVDDSFYRKIYVETSAFYISDIENYSINEDFPVLPIPFTVNLPNDDITGFLHITPQSSNKDLIEHMIIRKNGTQCTLEINPAPNEFGNTDITITAENNLKEKATQTFSLEIKPVNDAPSFTIPTAITLAETSGSQTFNNWAKNIFPGALNEFDQELSFRVSVDRQDLFYLQPEIDPITGDLHFFSSDNMNGLAQLSVYLYDNGGTSNNGKNRSETKSCSVIITPFSPSLSDNPVEKLKFISSNEPVSVGKMTPYIRVMTCDANDNAVIMESDTIIWLQTETAESGWFYVTNDFQPGYVVIPEGEFSALFKYINGRPGDFQIKASEVPDKGWSDAIMTVHVKSDTNITNGDIDGNGYIDLKDVIGEMQRLSDY
jgi:hypothetical protein